MTPKLTEEYRQALATRPNEPLQVEDPVTHTRYVLVRYEVFRRLQQSSEYDAGEPDPSELYPAFAEAVKDELDAPGMERYDRDEAPRGQP